MTTTIYGQSCLGIPDSKGELVPYLFRSVPPSPFARRAWTLTKPDGAEYRARRLSRAHGGAVAPTGSIAGG